LSEYAGKFRLVADGVVRQLQKQELPVKLRFFRRQMNMITKASEDMGIPAQPSRRTLALYQWLQQRMEEVYLTSLVINRLRIHLCA